MHTSFKEDGYIDCHFTTSISIKVIQELVKKHNLRFIANPNIYDKFCSIYIGTDSRESYNNFIMEYESILATEKLRIERRSKEKSWQDKLYEWLQETF